MRGREESEQGKRRGGRMRSAADMEEERGVWEDMKITLGSL